jgi:hypothetical protein
MTTKLQEIFSSLSLFSDLNWEAVTQEYESEYIDVSFPEYLQQKAIEGDCPPYLFELAFYELALFDAKTSNAPFPHRPGVYLNPTALFLGLEFDVKKMLEEASTGHIGIVERSHVLCLFRDEKDQVKALEVSQIDLTLLQCLEDGPRSERKFMEGKEEAFCELKKQGLILDLLSL